MSESKETETHKYAIYAEFERIKEERKAGYKDWFDSWNDRYETAVHDNIVPILNTLGTLKCDEDKNGDKFEYSCTDTEGKRHILYTVDPTNCEMEYPFIAEILPEESEFAALKNGKFPKCFDNPLFALGMAYVYLCNHILNDHWSRSAAMAKAIAWHCVYLRKALPDDAILKTGN